MAVGEWLVLGPSKADIWRYSAIPFRSEMALALVVRPQYLVAVRRTAVTYLVGMSAYVQEEPERRPGGLAAPPPPDQRDA